MTALTFHFGKPVNRGGALRQRLVNARVRSFSTSASILCILKRLLDEA